MCLRLDATQHLYLLPVAFPQKVLAANGAAKVSAYVTHGVFPKQSWLRFTHKDG
jgi:hypothetical protein